MQSVYLDNNATTMVDPKVKEIMQPYFCEYFGNPNSLHKFGTQTHHAIHEAISELYKGINADDNDDVIITGCATESNNWVLKGIYFDLIFNGNKKHIVTTEVEHPAVGATCSFLESLGVRITRLPINEYGNISAQQVEEAICDDTALVSIMWANNETGLIFPIHEIGQICKKKGVLFHTDAVQAIGKIPVSVKDMDADYLSLSAHKFYGPKGIGVLYARSGSPLSPFVHGGHQEKGMRAGTYNNQAIYGLGKAAELARLNLEEEHRKLWEMREALRKGIEERIPDIIVNGSNDESLCLPGTLNVSFPSAEGESILLYLDLEGIEVSTGSACATGSLEPSYVLLAAGLDVELAHGSIRFSFGRYNTMDDVDYVLEKLPPIIERVRAMSTRKV